jgi:hypothetical protein
MRSRCVAALQALAVLLLILTVLPGPAMAQVKTFVVFPFTYMGPKQYQHYGKGASSRFERKLTLPGTLEPAPDTVAVSLGRQVPASAKAARGLLAGADTDYLVWGNVSVSGSSVVLDVTMQSLSGDPIRQSAEVPMDEVTMELDRMAEEMTRTLFNAGQEEETTQGASAAAANPAFLNAQSTDQFTAAAVNPQFRYEGGTQNTGRWQSRGLRFASRSMAVCDATGDGRNEIFILEEYTLHAYRIEDGKLKHLAERSFSRKAEMINVRAIDLDRDGASELVVSSYRDEAPLSHIFRFAADGSGFTPVAEDVRMFLNVIRMPPNFTPTLVGQPKGSHRLMESKDIYEVLVTGGDVIKSRKVAVPEFSNVYNLAYLPEGETYKIIRLDKTGHIGVFSSDLKPEYVSQETYNSSAIPLELPNEVVPGMGTKRDAMEQQYYYVPLAALPTNLMTGGTKYELLMNKDISVAAQVFKRFRTFTQGEIHGLFWDGTGMNLSWKTRRIKGTVVDFDIADYNNDGQLDLLVLVNTYPGAVQLEYRKTVLFAYDLNLQ